MARPKKQTVDYFPHSCIHKKTIYILEQRYGNTGYAFWFKLLELLGSTEGHILDLNDDTQLYFLSAKVLINNDQCIEIINLLSKLDAIDRELWENEKIVWCQNFIDNIKSVYEKRTIEMPNKPSFRQQKPLATVEQVNDNPQTKVNETKLNKTKINKDVSTETFSSVLSSITDLDLQKALEEFIDYRKKKSKGFTVNALKLIIKELNKLTKNNDEKILILEQSIMSSWSGIFPLKEDFKSKPKRTIEANPEILKANAEATQRKKEREAKEQNDQDDMFAKMTPEEIKEHLKKLGIGGQNV